MVRRVTVPIYLARRLEGSSIYIKLLHSGSAIYARAGGIPPAIDKIFISCVLSGYVRISPLSLFSIHLSISLLRLRNRARMTEQSNRLLNKRCRPTCRAPRCVRRVSVLSLAPARRANRRKNKRVTTSDGTRVTLNKRYVRMMKPQSSIARCLSAYLNKTVILAFNFDYVIVVAFTPERRRFFISANTSGRQTRARDPISLID